MKFVRISNVGALWLGQAAEAKLRQISKRCRDQFYFAFVSNHLKEEGESECIEYKV